MNTIEITNVVEHDGLIWTVTAVKSRGWLELTHSDGTVKSARSTRVELLDYDHATEEDQEDEDEGQGSSKMSEQLTKYREKYVPSVAASGKMSLSNGDLLARYLEGRTVEDTFAFAEYWLELDKGTLEAKYANLKNDGMRRMNAGNRLRALLRRAGSTEEPTMADALVNYLHSDEEQAEAILGDGAFWRYGIDQAIEAGATVSPDAYIRAGRKQEIQ